MTEQAQLFTPPPVLNDRQQAALHALEHAPDGLYADELGAHAHTIPGPRSTFTHSPDARCAFCGKAGRAIGDKLVTLGLARRKRGERGRGLLYLPAGATQTAADALRGVGPGDLPEGF